MLEHDMIQMVGLVLGGLAIFIYGINMMSDALKSVAGYKIREYIEKYTRNLLMSITVGAITSALLHSSSAVTVISISLVRAGLMGLKQAVGITIGANIGTCVTSIMIGLNIEKFAYYFVFIGIGIMFLAKRKKINYIGKIIAGFGLIFVGLEMMSDELVFIASTDWFTQIMLTLGKQPWFALLGGTIATGVMQSSTAVIGIVQKLYAFGSLTPAAGAAFIFGANVGTCITAILASVGGSVPTKRAAWFHLVYNIAGALLGMFLLTPFIQLTNLVNHYLNGSPEMYVAQAHFIFNVASTILVIPFVGQCVKLLEKLIPGVDSHTVKIEDIDELDDDLIERFPPAALSVAKKNTMRMSRNIAVIMDLSLQYLETKENEVFDELMEVEALVNKYDSTLSQYLLKIAHQPVMAQDQMNEYYKNYQVVKYLERISDDVVSISTFYKMVYEERGSFSQKAIVDLKKVSSLSQEMLNDAMNIFDSRNVNTLLPLLNEKEKRLNELEIVCRQNHFDRMKENICDNSFASSVILDILSLLEGIGDLALDIANCSLILYKNHEKKFLYFDEILVK